MPNTVPWTRREGKRFLFEISLLANLISLILIFISFVSPYWIISWPRVHSGFKRIGLWEVCFEGMVLQTDPEQKSYHGCWWILAPEFIRIRDWLMPPYMIWAQVAVTLCFCAQAVCLALMLFSWITTGMTQRDPRKKKRDPLPLVTASCIITVVCAVTMTITVLVFGVMFSYDRNWLPNRRLNYLSWSYGLAICSAFFSIFATLGLVTFVLIIRQEMREPEKVIDLSGYMPATSASTTTLPRTFPGSKPQANHNLSHGSSNPKIHYGSGSQARLARGMSGGRMNQSHGNISGSRGNISGSRGNIGGSRGNISGSNPNMSRDYRR